MASRFVSRVSCRLTERSSDGDIGQGDGVSDEERVGEEVVVEHGERVGHLLLGLGVRLLVVGDVALDRVDPDAASRLDLIVAEIDPLVDLGLLEVGRAEQVRVRTKASDVASDRARLEDAAVRGLQHRDLAGGGLRLERLREEEQGSRRSHTARQPPGRLRLGAGQRSCERSERGHDQVAVHSPRGVCRLLASCSPVVVRRVRVHHLTSLLRSFSQSNAGSSMSIWLY